MFSRPGDLRVIAIAYTDCDTIDIISNHFKTNSWVCEYVQDRGQLPASRLLLREELYLGVPPANPIVLVFSQALVDERREQH